MTGSGIYVIAINTDIIDFGINWNFTDAQQVYALTLEDSALTYMANKQVAGADASLTLTREPRFRSQVMTSMPNLR